MKLCVTIDAVLRVSEPSFWSQNLVPSIEKRVVRGQRLDKSEVEMKIHGLQTTKQLDLQQINSKLMGLHQV